MEAQKMGIRRVARAKEESESRFSAIRSRYESMSRFWRW